MKKTIALLLSFAAFIHAKAQDDYKNVMLQNIRLLDTTKEAQVLSTAASTFAAIYDYKKEWHPLYYECLAYIKLSEAYQSNEQKKAAIDKAWELLQDLPKDNDEVLVLQSLYAMNYLGIDRSAWQTYMPMITDGLAKAESINPNNPRIYYLRGLLKYNMPSSMGGGHDEGRKLFNQAKEKYENYKPTDDFAPSWGKINTEKYLSNK
jgi:hypothetical protein